MPQVWFKVTRMSFYRVDQVLTIFSLTSIRFDVLYTNIEFHET